MRMRVTASVVLMLVGIVFAVIYAIYALVPLLSYTPLKVTWTQEATYFYGNYTAKVFDAVGGAVDTSFQWTKDFAASLANETDLVVHVIDVRVGMARVWWELSNGVDDPSNRIFPGRWTWNRWTPDQLGISFVPQACYDRLKEADGMAVDQYNFPANWLPVDWSFEAVIYYWNPGEPYYNIPDQPDMKDILLRETGGYTEEFRVMFANATTKAEAIASADDKIVDLPDLREAIAIILQLQYPDKYATLAEAQLRLEALEAEVGLP